MGDKSSKKTKQNKNKTKTPQNHRRPATASVMQSQLEGSLHWQKNSDPKEGFPDGWLLSISAATEAQGQASVHLWSGGGMVAQACFWQAQSLSGCQRQS